MYTFIVRWSKRVRSFFFQLNFSLKSSQDNSPWSGWSTCNEVLLSFLKECHGLRHSFLLEPLQKTLNLSESVKNSIITAEAVLLLLCVLVPGTMLLCKVRYVDLMFIQHIKCVPFTMCKHIRTTHNSKQTNKVIPWRSKVCNFFFSSQRRWMNWTGRKDGRRRISMRYVHFHYIFFFLSLTRCLFMKETFTYPSIGSKPGWLQLNLPSNSTLQSARPLSGCGHLCRRRHSVGEAIAGSEETRKGTIMIDERVNSVYYVW